MTFDARDLRAGKDVFDADGVYLGTVVWVITRPPPGPSARPGQPSPEGPAFSGEALGPMPTAAIGNGGPRSQSPSTAYGTASTETIPSGPDARQPAELVVLRLLTSLNWSTLRPRVRRIPIRLVQAVSHERIVLTVPESTLKPSVSSPRA